MSVEGKRLMIYLVPGLARFSFKHMQADRVQRIYIHLLSYQIVTVSGSGVSVLD